MAWISLDEVLSSILNSDDERGDFGLLESAMEDEEGQQGGIISTYSLRSGGSPPGGNFYKCDPL